MTDINQNLSDPADLRRYFAIIEHMADDDLDIYQYRLLGHYKRVCGANGGQCTESVRTTASQIKGMSIGKVSVARRELERLGWIAVTQHWYTSENGNKVITGISVRLIDRMAENVARYSKESVDTRSQDEQGDPHIGCSHGERLDMGEGRSQDERGRSPGETKKELDQEEQDQDIAAKPRDLLFDALAEYIFDAKPGSEAVKAVGGRVGKLKRLCTGSELQIGKGKDKRTVPGCSFAVTPDHIHRWRRDYLKQHTGASLPRDPEKFAEHFYPWIEADYRRYIAPTPSKLTEDEITAGMPGGVF